MFYKNTSYTVKTFYGVTFKPGETKDVNGVINNKWMILVDDPKETKPQQKPSPDKPKKEAPKAEQKPSEEAKQVAEEEKKSEKGQKS